MAGTKAGAQKARDRAARARAAATEPLPSGPGPAEPSQAPAQAEFTHRDVPPPRPSREPEPEPILDVEPEPLSLMNRGMVENLYGVLGNVEIMVARKLYGMTEAEATSIFRYTARDIDTLAPPTEAVVNKYASVAVTKWREEVGLLLALIYVHQAKIVAFQDLLAKRPAPVAAPKPKAAPQPINSSIDEESFFRS